MQRGRLAGETGATYVLTPADVGQTIRVVVTAAEHAAAREQQAGHHQHGDQRPELRDGAERGGEQGAGVGGEAGAADDQGIVRLRT